jgi:dihydrofolate synthase/folylpolyglutamate synthase
MGRSPSYVDLLARLEKVRHLGVSLGLERVYAALNALGNPQRAGAFVHIAGTNGKGSTAAMTAAVLRQAGFRTGLYTSPHLSRFTERIVVDGREVEGDLLARLDARIEATGVALTYFEVATVLAFLAFAEAGVEVSVLETGLGGRLDATTCCEPVATAITGIAFDHTEILGGTLPEIAREKAGIAKPGVPLFLGPMPHDAEAEILRVAGAVGAPVLRLGREFHSSPRLVAAPITLPGAHQQTNAAIAIALARTVATHLAGRAAAVREVTDAIVEGALAGVVWPGRLETVAPDVLLDCAHNPDGAAALARHLLAGDAVAGSRQRRALILSVVNGKAADGILDALAPCFDMIYATRSSSERALAPEDLRNRASEAIRGRIRSIADPLAALDLARAELLASTPESSRGADASPGALPRIVVAGSIFLVGDVRAALLHEARDPIATSDPVADSSRR